MFRMFRCPLFILNPEPVRGVGTSLDVSIQPLSNAIFVSTTYLSDYLSAPTRLPPVAGLQSFARRITNLENLTFLCTRIFSSCRDAWRNFAGSLKSTIEQTHHWLCAMILHRISLDCLTVSSIQYGKFANTVNQIIITI